MLDATRGRGVLECSIQPTWPMKSRRNPNKNSTSPRVPNKGMWEAGRGGGDCCCPASHCRLIPETFCSLEPEQRPLQVKGSYALCDVLAYAGMI